MIDTTAYIGQKLNYIPHKFVPSGNVIIGLDNGMAPNWEVITWNNEWWLEFVAIYSH